MTEEKQLIESLRAELGDDLAVIGALARMVIELRERNRFLKVGAREDKKHILYLEQRSEAK